MGGWSAHGCCPGPPVVQDLRQHAACRGSARLTGPPFGGVPLSTIPCMKKREERCCVLCESCCMFDLVVLHCLNALVCCLVALGL